MKKKAGILSRWRQPQTLTALLPVALLILAALLPPTALLASRSTNGGRPKSTWSPAVPPPPRAAAPRQQVEAPPALVLSPAAERLNQPLALACLPSGQLLLATRPAPSVPYELQLIASDGSARRFSSFSAAATLRLAVAPERLGKINPGEIFLSTAPATIARLSADGTALQSQWAALPGEKSLTTALCLAGDGPFKGRLIAATSAGRLWLIDDEGKASLLADLATSIAGLAVVPDDATHYGDWAGKLLAGAKNIGGLYAIDGAGKAAYFNLAIHPQDLKLIPAHQNFFGLDAKAGTLWRAPASQLAAYAGDLLIAQEAPGYLARARFTGKQFVIEKIGEAASWEQIAFGPECATSLMPSSAFYNAPGSEGEFAVTAPAACNWTAVSDQAWLEITSASSGTGNGMISYLMRDNDTQSARQGTINVNGVVFTVTQDGGLGEDCQNFITPKSDARQAAGGSGTFTVFAEDRCAWQATSVDNFVVITSGCCGIGNGTVSYTIKPNPGSGRGGKINVGGQIFTVKQKANLAPIINAGPDQTVTLPNTANLSATLFDDNAPVPATLSWTQVSGPGTAIFSSASNATSQAIFSTAGTYVMRLAATDTVYTASDDVVITVNPDPTPLTPDPVTVAPPINPTVTTTLGAATQFLYTGPNPIQTGVAAGTIQMERAAVLRGRVIDHNGAALSRVKITVLDHPELGQTLSRADGRFDMAVNGGGLLTVQYEKVGYITSQRQMKVEWQQFEEYPDVALMGYDPQVTAIDLSTAIPIQVAQGSVMSDSDGSRRSVLMFKQGTTATMVLANNSTQGLVNLHVRTTEFTVGDMGNEAMPGDLPATSGYTYAVEFSVDEAVAAGAKAVQFNQPVINYLENFLNFPVGVNVPSGVYDRESGIWMPQASGRVVKILAINNGLADLDIDGNGQPADDDGYAGLGVTVAERQQLATLYSAGQGLWRVAINHFSPCDLNWNSAPIGAEANQQKIKKEKKDCENEKGGSIIECQSQTLGERVGLVGTPFTLNYRSDRVPGRTAAYMLTIPVSGASPPAGLKRIELAVHVAGRVFNQTFTNAANQTTTFTWDGKDAYGRTLQGRQRATVFVDYVYDAVYNATPGFGDYGDGTIILINTERPEATLRQVQNLFIGPFDMRGTGLGGWSLSEHHAYDPNGQIIYLGNGRQRSAAFVPAVITTFAGGGTPADGLGDGLPATQAQLNQPEGGIVAAPDGSLYIADSLNHRIRKIGTNGIITTVAGNGTAGYNGDGIPATQAQLNEPGGLALGTDGSLYIADTFNHRVRKVAPNGIITTVAGTGNPGYSGDGGPATGAELQRPRHLALAPDGSLYLFDYFNFAIRRITPDGIITTIGRGNPARPSGNRPQVSNPAAIAIGPDGKLYTADFNGAIYRINADRSETLIAGGGNPPDGLGDGGPATEARTSAVGLTLAPDGSLYIAEPARIRAVGPDGIITTIAGHGGFGFSGDGGPAPAAEFLNPGDLGVGPDGSLYLVDTYNHRIRKITPPLPGFSASDLFCASEDGSELFHFNNAGRHLRTINPLTGANRYVFSYDGAGRLTQVTDGDGNVTTIEHDANGNPTAIVAPFGQRTTLALDTNGFINRITDPATQAFQLTYTAGGLLTGFTNPRGQTSIITYDASGRLLRDTDAATGFNELVRSEQSQGFSVALNTALNRTTTYQVQSLSNGGQTNTNTDPAALQTRTVRTTDGVSTTTSPDGMVETAAQGGDPRWGMQAPFIMDATVTTPGGLNNHSTSAHAVTLANPADPLSLVTQTDTFNINGRTTTSLFTAATRTFNDTTPMGRQRITVIDLQGRPATRQFANLNASNFTYDARGRLTTLAMGSGATGRTASFGYDSNGFLASITDPLNHVTGFTYDAAGRVNARALPDGRVVGFGYDANGNLTSLVPPGRPAHSFTFTPVDLVATYTPPAVASTGPTQYAYNLDRQLITITRPDNLLLTFAYDSAGRLSTLTVPNGQYLYAYNATTGRLTGITAPGSNTLAYTYDGLLRTGTTWGGTITGNVSHTFDNNFRVSSQSVNGASTVSFTYDDDNLLTGAGSLLIARNPQNGLIDGTTLNLVTDTRGHNNFGEITSYSASFNASGLYSFTYTRDKLGRITQAVETIGGVTGTYDYTYDLAGRLTEVKKDNLSISAYVYDNNDNRASRTTPGGTVNGAYDNQDRLTQYGTATYTYTANGELSSKTVNTQTTLYDYDVLGNLRHVTLPDNTQLDYVIDGQNRRIGKRLNGTLVQGFLYQDQLKPVAELDGAGVLVSRFVYGSNAGVPDYMIKGGVTYRIIADRLDSPRLVVDVATGVVAQRMDYDEFGAVTLDTNPGFQPFGFAGGLYDRQTGLTRFGARDYDAETGRWTSKDPILFKGRQTNLYAYVFNNPVNWFDPSGLDSIKRFDIDEMLNDYEEQREDEQLAKEYERMEKELDAQRAKDEATLRERQMDELKDSLKESRDPCPPHYIRFAPPNYIHYPAIPPPQHPTSVLDQIRPEKQRARESGSFSPVLGGL